MNYTFEKVPLANKQDLRQGILALFERDIATVPCTFNRRNYGFLFAEGSFPAIIRIEIEKPHRKAEDILGELMWIDEVKNDIRGVCQPLPSLENHMVERLAVGKTVYLVTMFRKPNGGVLPESQWDKTFFYNAGVLLGKIHRTSSESYQLGFRYKVKHWDESPYFNFSCYDGYFAPDVRQDAEAALQRIKSIPHDPRWYSMIHGDFHYGNLFCDWGEQWLFNFDDCCYGYFMFDIACMANICIQNLDYAGTHPNMTARDRLLGEDGILTQLRAGYSTEYQLPQEQWDRFDDFLRLCIAQSFAVIIVHEAYPKDILVALDEPMLAYLKADQSPIDRIEQVQHPAS